MKPGKDAQTINPADPATKQPLQPEHGGNVYQASRETGVPVSKIIDFSASINPLGVPDSVRAAISEAVRFLPHYPEPYAETLASELANNLEVSPASVLCGNGSTELIYLLVRALAPKKVLLPEPTFSEYGKACIANRAVLVGHRLSPDFQIDPDRFGAAMRGCDMAFLCNPNNPTGRLLSRDAVLSLAGRADRVSCWLVVDEAFIDFAAAHSVADAVADHPRLIVLRSLTKFFALSGLRIGFAVLPGAAMTAAMEQKEPWTVNSLAQCAGIAAMRDKAYQERTLSVIAEEKAFLEQGCARAGIEYTPSAVNYYLLRMESARQVVATLRKKGMLLRDCSNFPGLGPDHVRIAVRLRNENELLLRGLVRP